MLATLHKVRDRLFHYPFDRNSDYQQVYLFYRIRFFQFMTVLFLAYLALYTFINIKDQHYYNAIFDLVAILYMLLVLWYLHATQKINTCLVLILPLFTGFYYYFIFIIPAEQNAIIWVFGMVLFLLYSSGSKHGQYFTLYSLLLLILFYAAIQMGYLKNGYQQSTWHKVLLVHIVVQLIGFLFAQRYFLVTRMFEHQYFSDSLTNLPNRLSLDQQIKNRSPENTLILVNIKEFASINNFYGRSVGDTLLIQVAEELQSFIDDYVWELFRLNADEFALLSRYPVSQNMAQSVAYSLLQHIHATEFRKNNEIIKIRLYCGISNEHFQKVECADMALSQGRHKNVEIQLFNQSIDRRPFYYDNLRLLTILNEALFNQRIVATFQPIFNNNSGQVDRAEALMRIQDKKGQLHPPGAYLPVARRAGLYPHLSAQMIKQTTAFIKKYELSCALNITGQDLLNHNFLLESINSQLNSKLLPLLTFELVEDDALDDIKGMDALIDFCQKHKCRIAIDDFGAGYANFRRLMDLDIDYLKLDGSLIHNLDSDYKSRLVVKGIMDLARQMDIEIVAEYVHSKQIAQIVTEMDIHYSQGYFYGGPLQAEPFAQNLAISTKNQ